MGPVARKLVASARIVHLVCSMLALAAVVLFAVTGFVLNHEETFGLGEARDSTVEGTMPAKMVERAGREEIVSHLRDTFSVRGELDEFKADEYEIRVTFKRPGGRCDVTIDRPDGQVQIIDEPPSVMTVLVDLHRGEGAGPVWGVLMDATALCLLVACLSGIVLWLATPKRRTLGLIALATGLLVWSGAYLLFTPK